MTFGKVFSSVAGVALVFASAAAFGANVAVFGDNFTDDFLNGNGHTATVVTDQQLATPGFLDAFDLFVYTRNGTAFSASLSNDAAANVAAFVEGNVVLFAGDLQDGNFAGEAATLMLNAVGFAGQKGFIGEWSGSCAAVTSNSEGLTPLGLIDGTCAEVSCGQAGDPITVLQPGHPVVAGVPAQFSLGNANECFAIVSTDPSLIIAESAGNPPVPSILAGEGMDVGPNRATFKVTKEFTDDRTDEVDVTLTCNSGLPLVQNFTIAGGDEDGVTFVVTDLPDDGATCEVTESGGPDNYMPEFNDGMGCEWSSVIRGDYSCTIVNYPEPAEYTVKKLWEVPAAGYEEMDYDVDVMISCTNDILSATTGSFYEGSWSGVIGETADSVTLEVDTSTGTAYCTATETITQSGVEGQSSASCTRGELAAGGSATCTITNTVFFEGIPTLSQYGLAVLALLMLGVGFIGFRRFI